LNSFVYFTVKYFKNKLGIVLSFSIRENVVDEGLQLPHYGTIVINGNARIGKNCRIHVCVNIGASGGSLKASQIGDCVYIAPGAKIYGDITIANRIAIAANAAVSRSFLSADKLIGGVPAKEIGDINILDHIKINESI
jgi:serine O-acetyltransferase